MAKGISTGTAKKKAKRITAKQKVARKKNIAIARKYRETHGRKKGLRLKTGQASMDSVVTKKGRQTIMGGQNRTNKWLRLIGGGWVKNY